MSSSSLSIAAGEENGRTPCGRGGASPVSAPPYPRRRQRKPSQTAAGKRRRAGELFLGRWRGRGTRKGRGVAGGGCSEEWEEGRREIFWGLILPGTRAWGCFSTVPHGAGAPDRVLPRRGRRSPIFAPSPKSTPAAFWEAFWGRRWRCSKR
jgi:hypothetical protein